MAVWKNPFPGMNPFLEQRWGDFQTALTTYCRDLLQYQLPDDLRARMEERVYIETEPRRVARPDVIVYEQNKRGPAGPADAGGVAVAEIAKPLLIRLPQMEVTEVLLNIIDARHGGKVITSIEFVSPANKAPGVGRDMYIRKQTDCRDAGVNLVEVDLIRGGLPVTLTEPRFVPLSHRSPYHVSVFRAARRVALELEYYAAPLRNRLPSIAIPLREGDADIALNLQSLVDEACLKGRYDDLGYDEPLDPPLSLDDAAWAERVLQTAGLS